MLFFRLPFENTFLTVVKDSAGPAAVSFVSFDENQKIDFDGKIQEITADAIPEILASQLVSEKKISPEEDHNSYCEKLANIVDFIAENHLKKLVISRQKTIDFEELYPGKAISLTNTFLNLCKAYPNALSYFFIKEEMCWMGAFSEVLAKFNRKTNVLETMSLAGTLPLDEDWTVKEIEEQQPVSKYISDILSKYSDSMQSSNTYDHISGNIKHLRKDFKAKINPDNLEILVSDLHPTPAVCGIPKEFCKAAIAKFENSPRKLYSGYIRIETDDFIQYFVNLRCAEFFKNKSTIYVGGGITAKSDPEKEWRETELKSEAILKNIGFL